MNGARHVLCLYLPSSAFVLLCCSVQALQLECTDMRVAVSLAQSGSMLRVSEAPNWQNLLRIYDPWGLM